MNIDRIIEMIEALREEYRELLQEATDGMSQVRYAGAIEGFNVVLGDLRTKKYYYGIDTLGINELIAYVKEQREEYRELLEEVTVEVIDHKKQIRYTGAIEGFSTILGDLMY